MSREIKFRAWNKVKKQMVTDAINNCKDSFEMILKSPQIYETMQYTGLKDKNGVEIYEGDIIKVFWANRRKSIDYIVKYCDECAYFLLEGFGNKFDLDTLCGYDTSQLEVIGNIYKNKDLLKEEY